MYLDNSGIAQSVVNLHFFVHTRLRVLQFQLVLVHLRTSLCLHWLTKTSDTHDFDRHVETIAQSNAAVDFGEATGADQLEFIVVLTTRTAHRATIRQADLL